MEDIEIARSIVPKRINEIADSLKIPDEYIEQYGKYKAKISNKYINELKDKKDGKLIKLKTVPSLKHPLNLSQSCIFLQIPVNTKTNKSK